MAYATKKQTANGIVPLGSNLFGVCTTGASTVAKVVSLSAFDVLVEGVTVHVYFANGNIASNPTLKVGSTNAVPIVSNGSTDATWDGGGFISFTYYNGSWIMNDVQEGGSGSTYIFSITDHTLTITDAEGNVQTLTLPDDDTTYSDATESTSGLMSASDKVKLNGIASGAEVNVQSDWDEADTTADDYIKNKPTIPNATSDLTNDSGFITSPNIPYLTCATAAATAAKVATLVEGELPDTLTTGMQVAVKFTNSNTNSSPTLKVGDYEAKTIKKYGTTAPGTSAAMSWYAGSVVILCYDGTYWQMVNWDNTNTTYSEISVANITNSSGSTAGLVTGRRAKSAVQAFESVTDVQVNGTSVVTSRVANITATDTPTADTIAEFDADAHINSEDMSAQDVSDFVDGLNAQGANLADYVVEQGTDGIWTYRKWNSGIAECWGIKTWTVTSWTAWGSLYFSTYSGVTNYPTDLFISKPVLTTQHGSSANDAWLGSVGGDASGNTKDHACSCYLLRPVAGSNNITAEVYLHAIGTWK